MNKTDTDVLIVGAGVIGLCSGLALLQQGRSVTVLDQAGPGSGSSHGNCGTLTPSHALPLAAPGVIVQALRWMLQADAPLLVRPRLDPALASWMWQFSKRCNRRDWLISARGKAAILNASRQRFPGLLAEHAIDCEFEESGLVYAFRDANALQKVVASRQDLLDLGIEVQVWDADRLAAEEPALRPGVAGGMYFPGDARLRPDRYVAGLAARFVALGGCLLSRHAVRSIDPATPAVSLADGRVLRAGHLVLAAGAWSPGLVASLGLHLPIQPGKGYSITFDRPAQPPRRPLVLKERAVCVTTWGSGYRLGSTMEFAGYDSRLTRPRLDALTRAAAEYLHEPYGAVRQEEWFGWRPMMPDDLPVIGPVPRFPKLLLASGHGMLGVSMSATTGDLVAAHVCASTMPIDPTPYLPARLG